MRISEDRYTRDLRRIHLAQRLIQHEVRTRWICAWTGLTGERVRNLYQSYATSLKLKHRRRGPSPTRTLSFVRSPLLHSEASALAGLAYRMRVIPAEPIQNPQAVLAGLELGERMCRTFELYRHVVGGATLTMEHFILLVFALAERATLELGRCEVCQGALIVDRLGTDRRVCPPCRRGTAEAPLEDGLGEPGDDEPSGGQQQSLF
jgi:hypothetical protein